MFQQMKYIIRLILLNYTFRCMPCDDRVKYISKGVSALTNHIEKEKHRSNYAQWMKNSHIVHSGTSQEAVLSITAPKEVTFADRLANAQVNLGN